MMENEFPQKKIVIPGGSGYLGQYLANYFSKKGYEIFILSRNPKVQKPGIYTLLWDGKSQGDWMQIFENATAVINLSGKSVDCRYTDINRKEIITSRLLSTEAIGLAFQKSNNPPPLWINASSATYYKDTRGNEKANDEKEGKAGTGFSVNVCKQWEQSFFKFNIPNIRKIALRISFVLGNSGGALPSLIQLSKLGLGGKMGRGEQFISWIHEEDFARIIDWLITQNKIEGIINCTSPHPEKNVDFMKALRTIFHIPFSIPSPEFLIHIGSFFLRTEPELILKSRKVFPLRLLESGFQFKYPNLREALEEIAYKRN
ncbi:MAG: TIGR01777 family protein [Leptospiraceae bacterium]|nr:TIGR01777 family oxidoreductase [Leptospiraceae bacterium]MCP5499998.1 TIGR01777 family protein [Leptospiraceae bacterium]